MTKEDRDIQRKLGSGPIDLIWAIWFKLRKEPEW